jgi:DNA-binding MarR family transcriptional regulator
MRATYMGARQLSSRLNDVTEGGRHLRAISTNKNLTATERAVLHAIAARMDYRGDFRDERWILNRDIQDDTALRRSTVFKTLRSIEAKGYIKRRQVQSEVRPLLMASYFRITAKLFNEYEEYLEAREKPSKPLEICRDQSTTETGVVSHVDGGSLPRGRNNPTSNPTYNPLSKSHHRSPPRRPERSMYTALPEQRRSPQVVISHPPEREAEPTRTWMDIVRERGESIGTFPLAKRDWR